VEKPAHRHSTATEAARIAEAANAGRLILTHLDPRLPHGRLLEEAKASFPDADLGHDDMEISLSRSGRTGGPPCPSP
jgi:ribonuclease Z